MLNESPGILDRDDKGVSPAVETLPQLLLKAADTHRKADAFRFKRNGRWESCSHNQFLLRVEELFFALRTLGVKRGDRIAIISENRVEWAIADYAGLCLGASIVPIYPTLSAPQVETVLLDSRPIVVFLSTAALLEKLRVVRIAKLARYVVAFDPEIYRPGVLRLDVLCEIGRQFAHDHPRTFG